MLNLAVAQRLLRRLCQTCKLEVEANQAEAKIISDALKDLPAQYVGSYDPAGPFHIFKPNTENPCKECGGKAFKGRIAVYEMLQMTEELEKIILGTLSEAAMREEARRQGMVTMFQDGVLKVLDGICSLGELMEVAQTEDEEAGKAATA